ncbi:MAG: hypothetical protein QNJ77_10815 [Acidimicrobiia bacterium]|nr:hypothetical protein [Acidimicrobiia bacterium]
MPTKSAAEEAAAEAERWAGVSARWSAASHPEVWAARPGDETAVIPQVDPRVDLQRRARRWSYPLENCDLADLTRFAAALARAEAEAWAAGDGVVATQAFEERRYLAADRIVPWAVPWLLAVAEYFPGEHRGAESTAQELLGFGERHRLAPVLSGTEGLNPPGHDGYGPADAPNRLPDRIGSLWGGLVLMSSRPDDLEARYTAAAIAWRDLAGRYPGAARYWLDLASRADLTAKIAK